MSAENGSLRIQVMTAVILFVVFLLGLSTGAAVVYLTRERLPTSSSAAPQRPAPLAALRGIDVTSEQGERIHGILDKYHPRFDAALQEIFPRVHALQEQLSHEVRDQLTPEQQKMYDENEARLPFQARLPGRGPRPDRPSGRGPPPGRSPPPGFGPPPDGDGPPPDGPP